MIENPGSIPRPQFHFFNEIDTKIGTVELAR
jgi:hypothetical protein